MILTLANVLYVLVAVAMTVLILLQRGAGAAAGSGFGAGASATVFGARGASNFLSKSTAVLAAIFFILSLGMAMYATKAANVGSADADLGVMDAVPAASFETPALPTPAVATPVVTPAPADVPAPTATAPAETPAPAATSAPKPESVPDNSKGD